MTFQRHNSLIRFLSTVIISAFAAYSIALRFTNFFLLSAADKVLLLGFIWLMIALIGVLFITPAISRLLLGCNPKVLARFLISSVILGGVLLALTYRLPAFPKKIDLEIRPLANVSDSSASEKIVISSITRTDYPKQGRIPIDLAQLWSDGGWDIVENKLVYSPVSGQPGSVRYSSYVQGDIVITFVSAPDQGVAEIASNDEVMIVDLNSETPGEVEKTLTFANTWENADCLRKTMLAAGVGSDFISLVMIFFILLIAGYQAVIKRQLKLRGVFSLGFVMVISAGMLLLSNNVQQEVSFQEPAVEEAVRLVIDKPAGPIYTHQVLSVIELDLSGRNIQYLDGIEALRNLRVLSLNNNRVRDFTPLGKLRKLQELDLSSNRIHGISSLPYMPGLIRLVLWNNRISDVTSLAKNQQLEYLDLSANRIEDISPLAELYKLRTLNLRQNRVTDITPLTGLKNLTYLNLHSNNRIQDISPLENLTNLEELILRNIAIGDQVDSLANLTHLTNLNIRNSSVTDITFLADLFRKGALQDRPMNGVYASVNILDNQTAAESYDAYQTIRPYWDSITYRYPYVLPYFANNISAPVFSHTSGFYGEEFTLSLSTDMEGARMYYTLDGSEPTFSPLYIPLDRTLEYIKPLLISDRANDENVFSIIETSKLSDYFPPEKVAKANVVRAVVLSADGKISQVVTHTYFVDPRMKMRYSFPIVSITSSPEGLFSDELGIYVPGDLYQNRYPNSQQWNPANFTQRGLKWERPANFQMFNLEGDLVLEQNISVRIQGGASRSFTQKSLRLYAGGEYGENDVFEFDFFPELDNRLSYREVDTFETLVLRTGGGGDWQESIIRDVLIQGLLRDTKLDIQGYFPVVVFLDGEYWGIHNIRTRYDAYYFWTYYGIEPDDLVICEQGRNFLYYGNPGDEGAYDEMLKLIDEDFYGNNYSTVSTLSDQAVYDKIATMMDIENYIEYNVSQIFADKLDWPNSNIIYWKSKNDDTTNNSTTDYGHDGKWRWMVIDMDWSYRDSDGEALRRATTEGEENTFLLRSMLQNDNFRHQFLNRFADLLNTAFREEVVLQSVDDVEAQYLPEMEEHIMRWGATGGSLEEWQANIEEIREFAKLRPEIQRQQIVDYFDLPGTAELTIITDPQQGYVTVNTIDIREGTAGVDDPASWTGIYFQGVPLTVTAVPAEGYRFSHWEGLDNDSNTNANLEISLTGDLALKAVFTR